MTGEEAYWAGINAEDEKRLDDIPGPLTEEDDFGNCSGCHAYPCCCTADDKMLRDDWTAEIDAANSRRGQ